MRRHCLFGFKKTEVLGGVKFWTKRDDVEGETFLLHPDHKLNVEQQGLFAFLAHLDHKPLYIKVLVYSGPVKFRMSGPLPIYSNSIVLNVDGTIVRMAKSAKD